MLSRRSQEGKLNMTKKPLKGRKIAALKVHASFRLRNLFVGDSSTKSLIRRHREYKEAA